MLDVGWSEILVIAIILIVVVGPKELPQMLRTFGRMVSKMRGMAGEFRQQFDEALREADMDDVRKTLSDAQKLNPLNTIRDAVSPLRQVGNEIRSDIEKTMRADPAAPASVTAAEPVAVPSEAEKPASTEPVPAAPLKTGAVSKTQPVEAKARKPRKAATAKVDKGKADKGKTDKDAEKPVAKKPAARKPKTKKDEA